MKVCFATAVERVVELPLKNAAMWVAAFSLIGNKEVISPPPFVGGTVVNAFVEAAVAKESIIV